jgi:hypothetical protein
MLAIYIASTEAFSGKTSLAIGLGKHLQKGGYAVGYIKPLTARHASAPGVSACAMEDATPVETQDIVAQKTAFVRQELGLTEEPEVIAPILLTPALLESAIRDPHVTDYRAQLMAAYSRASLDKDLILVEGGDHPLEGSLVNLSSLQVIDLLDARVLAVVRYNDCRCIDTAVGLRTIFGKRLLGLVINAVPRRQMGFVHRVARPLLEERDLPVFAVLPEERLLTSISVRELVQQMHAEVLCCEDEMDGLIEYLMVGAMTAEGALTHFRRRPNKAVITGGDRHDVQIAALETSTQCLILTGNHPPSADVLRRAREVNVPIIVVEPDTLTTVRVVERIFGHTFVREPRKIARFSTILEERFNFGLFYSLLGIGS